MINLDMFVRVIGINMVINWAIVIMLGGSLFYYFIFWISVYIAKCLIRRKVKTIRNNLSKAKELARIMELLEARYVESDNKFDGTIWTYGFMKSGTFVKIKKEDL